MPGSGAFEDHVVGVLAPAHLDHGAFAADGVGAAVENVGGGDAAGERAVDGDVVGIEHVFDADHRGDRDAAFVDAVGGDVRVAIDDAGHQVFARGVDDGGAGGSHDLLADLGDLAVADEDGALEGALGDGQYRGVLNDARGPRQRRRTLLEREVRKSLIGHLRVRARWLDRRHRRGRHSGRFFGAGSNFPPSTKTYFTSLEAWKRSPLVTTRLAILPFSMLPRRSATP